MRAGLIDDFIRNSLSVPICPYHFVHAILSNTILSVYHFVRIPFCPYHFVRYHSALPPPRPHASDTPSPLYGRHKWMAPKGEQCSDLFNILYGKHHVMSYMT